MGTNYENEKNGRNLTHMRIVEALKKFFDGGIAKRALTMEKIIKNSKD